MKKSILIVVFFLFAITTVASLGVAMYSYSQMQSVKKSDNEGNPDSDAHMIQTISTVLELPDEKPTVINVTDKDKLQDQEFFKKAQNGDKVVIYESARRIYLYRPSIRKIIDVAPLVFNEVVPTVKPVPVASSSAVEKSDATASGVLGVEEQGNFKLE